MMTSLMVWQPPSSDEKVEPTFTGAKTKKFGLWFCRYHDKFQILYKFTDTLGLCYISVGWQMGGLGLGIWAPVCGAQNFTKICFDLDSL